MGTRRPRPVVLDAGALIAFERADPRILALVEEAVANGVGLHTPGAVVAQVWRDGRRQARLARLFSSRTLHVQPLDQDEAQATGVLCGRGATDDVVDASVVLLARRHGATVVTSDPDDIRRLDPNLALVRC